MIDDLYAKWELQNIFFSGWKFFGFKVVKFKWINLSCRNLHPANNYHHGPFYWFSTPLHLVTCIVNEFIREKERERGVILYCVININLWIFPLFHLKRIEMVMTEYEDEFMCMTNLNLNDSQNNLKNFYLILQLKLSCSS